jgi:indole-3-glycerol phosphate synthase
VSSADFLKEMARSSRARVAAARSACPEPELLRRALAAPATLPLHRSPAGFDLIAELKLRSPAAGVLSQGTEDVAARVEAYAHAGAACVSVLTEPTRFDGELAHLEIAAAVLTPLQVPAMRKDFLVDPYQLMEARSAGASGVLVILRMLSRSQIDALLDCARQLGLFVLLEAFDREDLQLMHEVVGSRPPIDQTADDTAALLAGLNCRDLSSLQIVPGRLLELVELLPATLPRVAESGVLSPQDAARVAAAGYQFALVGSALMQGGEPGSLTAAMLQAGREASRRMRPGRRGP